MTESNSKMKVMVLYEDNHLIAVFKPHGISTQGDESDEPSALQLTKSWLKEKYKKMGNVFLGVIHRIDKPVAGVLLFGKTSKGASRLSEQFRNREVHKLYEAVVEGAPPPKGRLEHSLVWDDANRRAVVGPGGKSAVLSFRTLEHLGTRSLLEINLETGRKHQIRCQLATEGFPIWGDVRYGAVQRGGAAIALSCFALGFHHPVTKAGIEVVLPKPLRLEVNQVWAH